MQNDPKVQKQNDSSKRNQKGTSTSKRLWKKTTETPKHILKECKIIRQKTEQIRYEEMFQNEDHKKL